MRYKLVVRDEADFDIEYGMDWYDSRQRGLGKEFLFSVKQTIKLIVKNPFLYVKFYLEIRKANINKFPYSVYYEIDKEKKR